ncbi:hypothetical protein [Chryseobacterium turcicum]|uniref:Uncharacterized protein n=1 Tax=Chryseobacterium turcicum TaxID=2898076 RepID=A0A9Q3YW43_9FLAO|nr:hypothetical protein [Chryseobacterium turcicum]MCD1115602.1 hypothetical protein [Chryseobacterium turcicum]
MKSQKIKIASNNLKIADDTSNITRTVTVMTDILELWKEEEVELTDDEINSLIQSAFSENTIEKIASTRSEKLRKKEQLEEHISWVEDIGLFSTLYPGLRNTIFSPYVYCKKGKILVKEGAEEEIERLHSYFISEEKDIELYNRHLKLAEDLNQFSEDLRKHTKIGQVTSAWLIRFNIDGTAYVPNNLRYDSN